MLFLHPAEQKRKRKKVSKQRRTHRPAIAFTRTLDATTACKASRAAACAAASSTRAARSRASAASASFRRASSTSAEAARREASRRTAASALREARSCALRTAAARKTILHCATYPRRASAVASASAAAPKGVVPAPASDSTCKTFNKPDSGSGPPPAADAVELQDATAVAPKSGEGGA